MVTSETYEAHLKVSNDTQEVYINRYIIYHKGLIVYRRLNVMTTERSTKSIPATGKIWTSLGLVPVHADAMGAFIHTLWWTFRREKGVLKFY